jgi:hypothetical protein
MSIPYANHLKLNCYQTHPDWHQGLSPKISDRGAFVYAVHQVVQFPIRVIQLIRDVARLIFKVPIRALCTPICLEKNWQEKERAKINAKLASYAFIQLVSVPVKFGIALIALGISIASSEKAQNIVNACKNYTIHLDGRAAQLEALKEEGAKKAKTKQEYYAYRDWLYSIDPRLCKKN